MVDQGVPEDPDELIRALEDTAELQKRLSAELEHVKAHRTTLIDAVRERRLLTWRRITQLFDMTETALQIASKARKHRQGG